MELGQIRDMLLWCTIINFGMLLLWFGMFTVAGGWIYRLHGRWFPMSREAFNVAHYSGIGLYKLAIFMFNLVPYLALLIVG
jgi:hypothetical protein